MIPEPDNQTFSETRKSLFLRLRPGEPAREIAWRQFSEKYGPIIAAFGRRQGVRSDDAADLVQEVMLRFFAASPEFTYDPTKGSFRGYLKVCTWRVLQRQLGKALRVNGRSIDEIDAGELSVDADWNDIWETERLRRAIEKVRKASSTHPDRSRTFAAFEMYVLFERPAEAVARELGMSVDSVHQAKTRVTQAVKQAMAKMADDMG